MVLSYMISDNCILRAFLVGVYIFVKMLIPSNVHATSYPNESKSITFVYNGNKMEILHSESKMNTDKHHFMSFVESFFTDTCFQRMHVIFPLNLQYTEEQVTDAETYDVPISTYLDKNDYCILGLKEQSQIRVITENFSKTYVIVSIPDTALETVLSFNEQQGTYYLMSIDITGDGLPFDILSHSENALHER